MKSSSSLTSQTMLLELTQSMIETLSHPDYIQFLADGYLIKEIDGMIFKFI